MSDERKSNKVLDQSLKGRPVRGTELSWCRAVSCGTGITVLTLMVSKSIETSILQTALHKLQNSHPMLRSKLHYNTSTKTFSFTIPPNPNVQVKSIDLSSPTHPLHGLPLSCKPLSLGHSHLQGILEHELNINPWVSPSHWPCSGIDVLFTTVYSLPDANRVVALRLHTSTCDRTTAVSLLRELMEVTRNQEIGGIARKEIMDNRREGVLGIEDMIPDGKAKKTMWAHGMDVLGYSVKSLRLTNLKFEDVKWPRRSEVVRLQMNPHNTERILGGCKARGIKLCGVLAAAGMMAAHSAKYSGDYNRKKYGVVTLTDCRSLLEPPLTAHHFGFYHSAILNNHVVKGGETLWNLAKTSYSAFAEAKNSNKHFTDMADLNFLMCRAIENPSLTVSSSQRTSLITVFEDPIIDSSAEARRELGVDDFIGCASVHGIGPSTAVFDTVRDRMLDCVCVYPSPLHSREQMTELVEEMKRILVAACSTAY